MANTVHPYKGYINTEFRIHTNEVNPQKYSVIKVDDETLIKEGIVHQNEYVSVKMPTAGYYLVRFENTEIPLKVEDGYKYGGNTHKNSFIFDKCPWAFIVMHDRTYFYNRETKEEYVEAISPDKIEEVNKDFVFLSNKDKEGFTLYSCLLQRPILFLESYEYHDDTFLIWNTREENSKKNNITIYSLRNHMTLENIMCDDYLIDEQKKVLYTYNEDNIYRFTLSDEITKSIVEIQSYDYFVTFIAPHHVVYSDCECYIDDCEQINIYDLTTCNIINQISYTGHHIARINKKRIININEREVYLKKLNSIPYPNLELKASYVEFDIYPTPLDTIYIQTDIEISVKQNVSKEEEEQNIISSSKTKYLKAIKQEDINYKFTYLYEDVEYNIYHTDNYILLYSEYDFFIINSSNQLTHEKGKIHFYNDRIYQKLERKIRCLDNNGSWLKYFNRDMYIKYLDEFGVIVDSNSEKCYFIDNLDLDLGTIQSYLSHFPYYLETSKYRIYKYGNYLPNSITDAPRIMTPNGNFGLKMETQKFVFFNKEKNEWSRSIILESLYDTSVYRNVLLSENGKQILYRTSDDAKMLNVETGEVTTFPNESHIQHTHINGIRPLIRFVETTQARLINPIDGQPIDADMFSEYQFVSPNGKLYADTELSKYIEAHNHITKEIYSNKEYKDFKKTFWHNLSTLPFERSKEKIDKESIRVFSIIANYIYNYKDFFLNIFKEKIAIKCVKGEIDDIENCNVDKIKEFLHEEYKYIKEKSRIFGGEDNNSFHALETVIERFINSFIEIKYVAIIRDTKEKKIIEKIYLSRDLNYLNYVAFSQDNRFVAIAGKPGSGGLMQLYDLKEHKTLFSEDQTMAVWLVTFGKNGHLAGYTSNPYTIILKPDNDYKDSCQDPIKIMGKSFLTFSPDGQYIACSEQGYIPYRNADGTTNLNWGHQPSSIVSLRNVETPETEIIRFDDLSDQGIEDSQRAKSVASVSFSQGNKRIMMTGNNGVVIIKNLSI